MTLAVMALALGILNSEPTHLAAQTGPTVRFRVNAGGPVVSSTPNWSADTAAAPSPFVNAAATTNQTFVTGTPINVSHPSIPAGTPASLFQSERWDPAGGAEMQWSFPVTPGRYQVRLYFAEIFFTAPGARVFNVAIEGAQVLNQYDIVADVGAFTGVMKSFTVDADTTLNILFSHVVENPKVSAIEILDASGQPGVLGSDAHRSHSGMSPSEREAHARFS